MKKCIIYGRRKERERTDDQGGILEQFIKIRPNPHFMNGGIIRN